MRGAGARGLAEEARGLAAEVAELSGGRPAAARLIGAYHAAISVRAGAAALGRGAAGEEARAALRAAAEAVAAFDAGPHAEAVARLAAEVDGESDRLAGAPERDAAAYGRLRELMSVKEFVGQYERGFRRA